MQRWLILIGICFFELQGSSQNWNFISQNERYHFQHVDDSIPLHTILIDSIQNTGELTTNFLNRLFLPCDTCSEEGYYLGNQPSFLQREFVYSQVSSTVILCNPEKFTINLPGSSEMEWWFDENRTQRASIDIIIKREVFGTNDSVAIITVDGIPQIEISKTYGLLKYFDYLLSGLEYEKLGECLPGYDDFYDFEVDDVFMYGTYKGDPEDSEGGSLKRTVQKVKHGEGFEDVEYFESYWPDYYPFVACENRYRFDRNSSKEWHYANTYPNQKINISGYCFDNCLNQEYSSEPIAWTFCTMIILDDKLVKVVGYKGSYSNAENIALPFNKKEGDLFWFDESHIDLPMEFEFQYSQGLGNTSLNYMEFEVTKRMELVGFTKSGVEYGTIKEGSCTNSISESEISSIMIFPNPSDGLINFEMEDSKPRNVLIYSVDGQLIDKFEVHSGQSFNFEHLPEGTYLIKHIDAKGSNYIKWIKQ